MKRFLKRRAGLDVEAELRAARPEPRPDLLTALAERVSEPETRRRRRMPAPRLVLVGGLTAALLAGVATAGGFDYAVTAAKDAVGGVKSVLAGSSGSADPIGVGGLSPDGDQYQPGFAWGDPNHNHSGPPALVRRGGEFAPPLVASCRNGTARIVARIVLDEQADLALSVLGSGGSKLQLAQLVGGEPSGAPTKTIRHRVLVPRSLKITLLIGCSELEDGKTYRIRIRATDPDGGQSTLTIPFLANVGTV